ncbi:MAG: YfhO family protein [Solobacterium sp.]|nr:YfhO family protein [Solobacterium sp.]
MKRKFGSVISAVIAAVMTAVLFALLMLVMKIYPFGDHTLLYGDGKQLISLYASIFDIVKHPDQLLYSWNSAMGTEMLEVSAAYLFSPLNYLLLLFRSNILLGFHVIAGLRLSLAAFTFCIWLNRKEGLRVFSRAMLGTAYAYTGFTITYLTNTSMIDGAVILPLLALGVARIYEGKGILVYVLSMIAAILTGYRLIAMFTLASVLIYFKGILDEPGGVKRLKRTFMPWFIGSVLSVLLCACVLIPIYVSTHHGYVFKMPEFTILNGDPADLLSALMTGNLMKHIPPIFIGIVPLVLAAAWFFDKEITLRHKAVMLAILGIALASIWIPIPYMFRDSVNVADFDMRCTCLAVFILMDLAAESRGSLESMTTAGYILTGILCAALLAGYAVLRQGELVIWAVVVDGLLMAGAVVLCWLIGAKANKIAAAALILLALGNSVENSWLSLHEGVKEVSAAQFYDVYDKAAGTAVQLSSDSLERTATAFAWGQEDGFLYELNSPDGYLEYRPTEGPAFARKLGVVWDSEHSSYAENAGNISESADGLMSVKYVLSKDALKNKSYTKSDSYSGINIYQNPFWTGVVTAVEELPKAGTNTFETQNLIWQSLSGEDDAVYTDAKAVLKKNGTGVTLTVKGDSKPLYMEVPAGSAEITVRLDKNEQVYEHTPTACVYYLGKPSAGRTVTVTIIPENGDDADYGKTVVYAEDLTVLRNLSGTAQKRAVNVKQISPAHLRGEGPIAPGSGYIHTSIPYSAGWNITVDGRTAIPFSDVNGMMCFGITEGSHIIEMVYRPTGFTVGMIISAIAVILLVVYMFALGGKIRRYRKQDKEEAEEAKRRAEEEARRAEEEAQRAAEEAARAAEEQAAREAAEESARVAAEAERAEREAEETMTADLVIPEVPAVKESGEIELVLPEPEEKKPSPDEE